MEAPRREKQSTLDKGPGSEQNKVAKMRSYLRVMTISVVFVALAQRDLSSLRGAGDERGPDELNTPARGPNNS